MTRKFLNPGGNIVILSLVLVLFFSFIFLLLADSCRIFVARSWAKKTADAVCLAVAQNLLFFDEKTLEHVAEKVAGENGCRLTKIMVDYHTVTAEVEKETTFSLLAIFGFKKFNVRSTSRSEIIFPWDESLGLCKSYEFDY